LMQTAKGQIGVKYLTMDLAFHMQSGLESGCSCESQDEL